jgi:hypothetical protein
MVTEYGTAIDAARSALLELEAEELRLRGLHSAAERVLQVQGLFEERGFERDEAARSAEWLASNERDRLDWNATVSRFLALRSEPLRSWRLFPELSWEDGCAEVEADSIFAPPIETPLAEPNQAVAAPAVKRTANDRMIEMIERRPEARDWSARDWSISLGFSTSTIAGCRMWRALMAAREAAKQEIKSRGVPERSPPKRR